MGGEGWDGGRGQGTRTQHTVRVVPSDPHLFCAQTLATKCVPEYVSDAEERVPNNLSTIQMENRAGDLAQWWGAFPGSVRSPVRFLVTPRPLPSVRPKTGGKRTPGPVRRGGNVPMYPCVCATRRLTVCRESRPGRSSREVGTLHHTVHMM